MRSLLAAVLAGFLVACGGAYSREPASEEGSTRSDGRLVGIWRVEGSGDAREVREVIVIGKPEGSSESLEWMHVSLQSQDRIQTVRGEFRGTTIGGKDFGSARLEGEDARHTWVVLRYAMPDEDSLRLVGLERQAVAEAVRSGAVPGTVSEEKSATGGEPELTVTLEARTPELRAWLEKAGDRILATDKPLVLRRVR